MTIDHRLIELLVCPVCKGPLTLLRDDSGRGTELLCPADRLAFAIRDGIPAMLETEARSVDASEIPRSRAPAP
jgi:uncharacterized protein YbaR (Trm112 family)